MPQITTKNHSTPKNDAAPKSRFMRIVPATPMSMARLPPSLSVSRPLMIWPKA